MTCQYNPIRYSYGSLFLPQYSAEFQGRRLIEGSHGTNHPQCISLFIHPSLALHHPAALRAPSPSLSLALLSHKQQRCQTAGSPKRAAHLSTSEHWKPATGAAKYIQSFTSECMCSFTCYPCVCVCWCVCQHLNAGDINIDPWQPLKLASKTVLIQHTPLKAQPQRSLTFPSHSSFSWHISPPIYSIPDGFYFAYHSALLLYPAERLLCLQVFASWPPPAAHICCLSSFPRQGV